MIPHGDRGKPLQAVLFDVGNTLLHLDYEWLCGLAQTLGAGASPDDVGRADARVRRRGWPEAEEDDRPTAFFPGYFGAVGMEIGLSPADALAFAASAEREHLRDQRGIWRSAAPHAAETLQAIAAQGLRLGVVSNSDGRVEGQLALAGLRASFSVVIDSHIAGVEKPDPRIFHAALGALSVAPQAALYVGDLWAVDVLGAHGAGMDGVLYDRWGAYPEIGAERIRGLRELLLRIRPD